VRMSEWGGQGVYKGFQVLLELFGDKNGRNSRFRSKIWGS